MDFPPELKKALALPTGQYHTQELLRIKPEEGMCIDTGEISKTNATSLHPVIGTGGYGPCTAVILYNRKTKTAVISHEPPKLIPFKDMLREIRANETDKVEAHFVGAMAKGQKEIGQHDVAAFDQYLTELASAPNVTLKTFDVFTKPMPAAVGIDTRNGKLIRGSEVRTPDKHREGIDDFTEWDRTPAGESFDGTTPGQQRQKKR